MKGQNRLIAMRKSGFVPSCVLLHLSSAPEDLDPTEGVAWLEAALTEPWEKTDLRCVIGLKVFVSGPYMEQEAVKKACFAAVAAKASAVLGFASDRPKLDATGLIFAEGDTSWLG